MDSTQCAQCLQNPSPFMASRSAKPIGSRKKNDDHQRSPVDHPHSDQPLEQLPWKQTTNVVYEAAILLST